MLEYNIIKNFLDGLLWNIYISFASSQESIDTKFCCCWLLFYCSILQSPAPPPAVRSYSYSNKGWTYQPSALDLPRGDQWTEEKYGPFIAEKKTFILLLDSMPCESESFSFSQKERQMKCDVVLYKNLYFARLRIAIIRYSQRISHFMFQKPARVRMCVLIENRN